MAQDVMRTPHSETARGYGDSAPARARPQFRPRVDIYETEENFVVLAEMPGVGPDAVDITLERRVLTIRGRVPTFTHDSYRQIHVEYDEGDYERVFTLSEDIDRGRIKATQKDGILSVELPKAEPAKAKKITVQSS
jgi:HSP20 family molecular chaperone IbpA